MPAADRLQTPKGFDPLARVGDGNAIVRVAIENYGLVILFPQVKQLAIPNGQLRLARGLRVECRQGSRRVSVESPLRAQLKPLFVVRLGGDSGNGTQRFILAC